MQTTLGILGAKPRPGWAHLAGGLLAFLILVAQGWAAAPVADPGPLLDRFRTGPMSGVEEIVFAARKMNDTDGHWYANLGYYAHDPKRKAAMTYFAAISGIRNRGRSLHAAP